MARLIRPPKSSDVTAFMRMLFLKTEQELINEIKRKRKKELIEPAGYDGRVLVLCAGHD